METGAPHALVWCECVLLVSLSESEMMKKGHNGIPALHLRFWLDEEESWL